MNKITSLLLNNKLVCRNIINKKSLPFQLQNQFCSTFDEISTNKKSENENKIKHLKSGPNLFDFIAASTQLLENKTVLEETIPYVDYDSINYKQRKVFFDIYGCQMNVNDTEIVWSILKSNNFIKTQDIEEADVVLVITCAIRDSAESKIWNRLDHLRGLKKRRSKSNQLKIGILGCMAERLKHKLIEKEQAVDIVAGPDSYKDLPRLLAMTENNQTAVNVLLSLDETYADIMPVRLNIDSKTAFVSIMRGCDNMCTYCIVPFTRGRERSRPVDSIVEEIKQLSEDGVKEVTLLGQNVNSYRYLSESNESLESTKQVKGFKTVYKVKSGGMRFADLLDKVSAVDPEMRIRFTSPHPKDFPDEVLEIIKERSNICKSLHLPAQSGSSAVLERMRRGYTREAYLDLIQHVREVIPNVALSSDFICGFCNETDEEFEETLTLMDLVKYNTAYLFPYSMREKTTAHRRYKDDVPNETKQMRLLRMVELFRKGAEKLNSAQIDEIQIIMVEGKSKKSNSMLAGRNDKNIKVIIPDEHIPVSTSSTLTRVISPGDYVAVKIISATSQSLKGVPLFHTTLLSFDNNLLGYGEIKVESVL